MSFSAAATAGGTPIERPVEPMPRRKFSDPVTAAAYHEAGHAVMCHLLHLRIGSVRIDADELHGGETRHSNPFRDALALDDATGRGRLRLEKAVMLCLAGPVAQAKMSPDPAHQEDGGALDWPAALALAMRFFRSQKTAQAYIAFARAWVDEIFAAPRIWAMVERLAKALIAERRLSGREAEAIIRGASMMPRLAARSRLPL